ncbi:MAG: hypothetical protein R3230_05240 [Nitrosopumilaceae archaeon]|nr:hypothetical protein [Nitrosopumilaceae archaeon]
MKSSKKAAIIALVMGLGLFGYSQYASASQIGVVITESHLLEEGATGSTYNLQLEFDNPSLLVLTAGETEFTLTADGERIGDGTLDAFVLPPLDKTIVQGTFVVDNEKESDEVPEVRISGITKYDVLFTSIDVPFVYYPTEDQARAFIHQN